MPLFKVTGMWSDETYIVANSFARAEESWADIKRREMEGFDPDRAKNAFVPIRIELVAQEVHIELGLDRHAFAAGS